MRLASSLTIASLLTLVAAGLGPAEAKEPPPPPFDYDATEREFSAGLSPGGASALITRASAALARRKELADDAAARGSVAFSLTAQAKVQNWLGLGASAGYGHSGATVGLGGRWLRFKGTADPNDRSVTSQVELAYARDGDGALLKHAWSVKLEYADNRTYLRALGVDARNVPGMGMVIDLMDRISGREAEAVRSAPEGGGGVRVALEAAGVELKRLVPDMFNAATEFRRVTLGEGTVAESPGGDVGVTWMRQEQLERGQRTGEGRRWSEVSVSADIDKEFSAGRAVKGGAGVSIELKRTYGDPPPVDRDGDKSVAGLFAKGDLTGLVLRAEERLAPVHDPERIQRGLELLEASGEEVPSGTDRILAVPEDDVGGVRLQFDPQMLATAVAPARAARLLDRVLERFDAGEQRFVVRPEDGEVQLAVVSLAALLGSETSTLGSITRLRGCVVDGDDLLLLGEAEPGAPPIETDTLTVAARNVWKEGSYPFVSLDPDPADMKGPQRVRLGGILESTRETRFVRVMLDADYAMKRIDLGQERIDVPGFRCFADLLRGASPEREVLARAWLSPMRSTVADVWTWTEGGRKAFLFDTRVQVLSESMRRTREGLLGGGEVDPVSAEAADQLTCHYDAIARRLPVFAELRGLFSAVKLCAVLRARGVGGAALDRVAARTPRRADIPATYAGLHVEDGPLRMSGGALSRVRLSRGAFRDAPELSLVMDARVGSAFEASFPTTVGLTAEDAFEADGEVHFNRGLKAFEEADYPACERHMDAAVERDDAIHQARLLRAVCRLARGDFEAARADVDAVRPAMPQVVGLSALLNVVAGRDVEARRDLEDADRDFVEDDDVLAWTAQARLYRFDLREAERTAITLLRRSPTDPGAQALWETLGLLHRLGRGEARRRVGHMARVPLMINEVYAEGSQALLALDFVGARDALTRCLALLDAAGPHPDVDALQLRERCLMGLVTAQRAVERVAVGMGERAEGGPNARELAEGLLARRPKWASAHMLAATTLSEDERERLEEHLDAALALGTRGDPLLEDLAAQAGTDRVGAWLAFSLLHQAVQKRLPAPVIRRLLERTVIELGDSPETRLLAMTDSGGAGARHDLHRRVAEAFLALPTPLATDPVGVQVVGFVFAWFMGASEDADHEQARRRDVARWFLRATDLNDLPRPIWMQVGLYRMAAFTTLAEYLKAERAADPELGGLRLAVANRREPIPALRARLATLQERHRAALRSDVGPFLASLHGLIDDDDTENQLYARAIVLADEVPAGAERDAYRAACAAWHDHLAAQEGWGAERVAVDPASESTGPPERSPERLIARFEAVAAQAHRPADVQMLGVLSNVFGSALAQVEERDPAATARLRSMLERWTRGLTGEGLVLTPRDWDRWMPGPAPALKSAMPAPSANASPRAAAPMPAAADGEAHSGLHLWLLALVGAGVAGLLVLLVRRRGA